jgi:hypothetical protein
MKSRLMLSMLALAIGAATALPARADDDACRRVSFRFTNDHETRRAIKVVEVQYRNVVNNRNPTVDVTDVECAFGATCSTAPIDLRDVEGNKIDNIRFVYRYREQDGDWSDKTSRGAGPYDGKHKECRADRSYGPFALTGTLTLTQHNHNPAAADAATGPVPPAAGMGAATMAR